MRRSELPSGCFRFEFGSYGGPGRGYMPSILCYKQIGADSWTEHFCLVKPDAALEDEDAAAAIAEENLEAAHAIRVDGGSPQDFALSLRHKGYMSVSDFRMVRSEDKGEV